MKGNTSSGAHLQLQARVAQLERRASATARDSSTGAKGGAPGNPGLFDGAELDTLAAQYGQARRHPLQQAPVQGGQYQQRSQRCR